MMKAGTDIMVGALQFRKKAVPWSLISLFSALFILIIGNMDYYLYIYIYYLY